MAVTKSRNAKPTIVDDTTVRPFQIEFPQDQLDDLRRRINATRWPERETVGDDSQGIQLATMQTLADAEEALRFHQLVSAS